MNLSVECNTDHYIISSLIKRVQQNDFRILHQQGKPGVIKRIMKKQNEIGIIDEDPWANQHPDLAKFELRKDMGPFQLFVNVDNNCRLIVMQPFLEEIIVDVAKIEGINSDPYGLILDSSFIHQINPYRNIRYQEFLDLVLDSSGVFHNIIDLLI